MVGLSTVFGSGAMTNSNAEIADAKTILVVGSNTTAAHPIIALQVKKAVRNGAKLIVINPKEIELCQHATTFIQNPPGSDIAILMAMMNIILREGLADEDFIANRCENYDEFVASLEAFSPAYVAEHTGIAVELIEEAALAYGKADPASILYCMGITQHVHGTDNVWAIANLAMLTGNLGKKSAGVNPLRGQNNVQGACDMGALPDVYPGYKKVDQPENNKIFAEKWDGKLSSKLGLTHTEIFDGLYNDEIKAMYLIGENPVLSEANAGHAIEAMKRAKFMVVQDIFMSETAELADVILPASSFAEKDGTFTNTERRVQRVRKAIDSVGDSKPDWWIIQELAKKMGAKGFDHKGPEEIFVEIADTIANYAGINYKRLNQGSLQWPCTSEEHSGTLFLHGEKFGTKSGKAHFTPLIWREVTEKTSSDFPLILTTDRSLFHFHSTMTRRVYGLNVLDKGEVLFIHSKDAVKLGIGQGELVKITSRRDSLEVPVFISSTCRPGTVSMSFHFSETPTNKLTSGNLDPVAKIPGTKVCAVKVEKIN